jgi:hypothetical protein
MGLVVGIRYTTVVYSPRTGGAVECGVGLLSGDSAAAETRASALGDACGTPAGAVSGQDGHCAGVDGGAVVATSGVL